MKNFLIKFIIFVMSYSVALGAELTVLVPGILEMKGTVRVGIWEVKNKKAFPLDHTKAFVVQVKRVTQKNMSFKFELPRGKYAVAIIQDLNMNAEIDKIPILGIPVEPYGFSMNARANFAPPDFMDAAFYISKKKKIKIYLEQ